MFNQKNEELIIKLTLRNTKENKELMNNGIKQLDEQKLLTNTHIFNDDEVVKYTIFTLLNHQRINKKINQISFYCFHLIPKTATEYYYSQKAKHTIKYYCFYCENDK